MVMPTGVTFVSASRRKQCDAELRTCVLVVASLAIFVSSVIFLVSKVDWFSVDDRSWLGCNSSTVLVQSSKIDLVQSSKIEEELLNLSARVRRLESASHVHIEPPLGYIQAGTGELWAAPAELGPPSRSVSLEPVSLGFR